MLNNITEEYFYQYGYYEGIKATLKIISDGMNVPEKSDWIKIGNIVTKLNREFESAKEWKYNLEELFHKEQEKNGY